jgi:hypothetical protein
MRRATNVAVMFPKDRAKDLRLQREFFVPGFVFGLDAYNKLLKFQGGVCAICKKNPDKMSLAVDHCWDTGLLRGALCFRCNKALGLWHDGNIQRLLNATEYLVHPPATKCFGRELFTAPGRLGTKVRAKQLKKFREGK